MHYRTGTAPTRSLSNFGHESASSGSYKYFGGCGIISKLSGCQSCSGIAPEGCGRLTNATSGADVDLLLCYKECHLLVLKAFQDGWAYGSPWSKKWITRCLIECRDEYKYNMEAVELLIHNHLLNMQQYDLHPAQSMENGLKYMAVAFAMRLVKILRVGERSVAHGTEADPFHTPEVLMGINAHSSGSAPEDCPS